MTNTLPWNTKFPIQLPKLNTNLLSVISLIVLFTTAFLTVSAVAVDCDKDKLEKEVDKLERDQLAAEIALEAAKWAHKNAEGLAEKAILWVGVKLAERALKNVKEGLEKKKKELKECEKKLKEFLAKCACGCGDLIEECDCDDEEDSGSGGCDDDEEDSGSGGCDDDS